MVSPTCFLAAAVTLPAPATLPALPPAALPPTAHLPSVVGGTGFLLLFLILSLIYFIPTILAWLRDHPKKFKIMMVNTFLGWTGIGYFVVLGWSLKKSPPEVFMPMQTAMPLVSAIPPQPQQGLIREVQQAASPVAAPIAAAPAPGPAPDDVEKLAKLGTLYEKGLLTTDEFQKAKAKIINI